MICDWSTPGHAPTTSPVAVTLRAMGIDSPELARRITAGEYAELVTVHANDRRAYGMTSGNAKWCAGEVDTSRWPADHAEQGRVYRVGTVAVVWFWRCGNLSLWTAPAAPAQIPAPTYMAGADLIPGGPIGNAPGHAYAIPLAPAIAAPGDYGAPSWGAAAGFGYAIDFQQHALCDCVPVPPCPVAEVPEPTTVVLIVAGLVLVVWKSGRVLA